MNFVFEVHPPAGDVGVSDNFGPPTFCAACQRFRFPEQRRGIAGILSTGTCRN
jgi:hypothetical protein